MSDGITWADAIYVGVLPPTTGAFFMVDRDAEPLVLKGTMYAAPAHRQWLKYLGLLKTRKPRRIRKLRTKGRRKNGLKERHR